MGRESRFRKWKAKQQAEDQETKVMTFSLDWKSETQLIKVAAKLTDKRQFAEFARIALRVIPALMKGKIEPLFEAFPWVKEALMNLVVELVEERVGTTVTSATSVTSVPQTKNLLKPERAKLDIDLDKIIDKLLNESKQDTKHLHRLEHKIDDLMYMLESPVERKSEESRFDDMEDDLLNISDSPIESGNSNSNFIANMSMFD